VSKVLFAPVSVPGAIAAGTVGKKIFEELTLEVDLRAHVGVLRGCCEGTPAATDHRRCLTSSRVS
jgi:hypothetical protein